MSTTTSGVGVGRELDALVAERVMGWEQHDFHHVGDFVRPDAWRRFAENGHFAHHIQPHEWMRWQDVPAYSTDIAAAWQVVEKMKAEGYEACIDSDSDGDWSVIFTMNGEGIWCSVKKDAPLAICRAALAVAADSSTQEPTGGQT